MGQPITCHDCDNQERFYLLAAGEEGCYSSPIAFK
jgi:hypothetical protein